MTRLRLALAVFVPALLLGSAVLAFLEVPLATPLARLLLLAAALLALLWLFYRGLRVFLWKVGRRLAFSYFLLGVLPIPMVLLLLAVAAYLLAGFFLGHLYRDAAHGLEQEVGAAAERRWSAFTAGGRPGPAADEGMAFAYYRQGRRVAGDERAPADWPAWLPEPWVLEDELPQAASENVPPPDERDDPTPIYVLGDGSPILAAAAGDARWGVVAFWAEDLEAALSDISDVWVELQQPGEATDGSPMEVNIGGYEAALKTLGRDVEMHPEAEAFFTARSSTADLFDRPLLWWGELSGPLVRFTDGVEIAPATPVTLSSTPRLVSSHLFSTSAELDAYAWLGLFVLAGLLFWIYFAAALMAVFLIFSLSRAVNRLSHATDQVQAGDFSARIPVRRRDQIGQMQRSFNQMAANLERLVAAATQKELLEKELAIARDLQLSLVPRDLPAGERVEFATLFEPSAAIGGDYFDILRVSENRIAVVVADVSGHGLSSGLRMAMLKAALLVLVHKAEDPEEILDQLDTLVRAEEDNRFFVTAVLALLDLTTGELLLLNAGHPPTYRLRGGAVEEILLPGSPLGGLGRDHGRRALTIEGGDILVWLSDGLIEATDPQGEPFGYERVQKALAGPAGTATEVRDRLLASVSAHTRGGQAEDDQTLVVLRYLV
jgi:serine phosphatase RsbU (regulator of sigma subunit)